jgi:ferredoxin
MLRVIINDVCVGSGLCVGIAPAHFRLGDDERSRPIEVEVVPDDALLDAAASCPMDAIVVADAATGEPLEL